MPTHTHSGSAVDKSDHPPRVKADATVFVVATLVRAIPAEGDLPARTMVRIAAPWSPRSFQVISIPTECLMLP